MTREEEMGFWHDWDALHRDALSSEDRPRTMFPAIPGVEKSFKFLVTTELLDRVRPKKGAYVDWAEAQLR